jgi:hypothetical protein
MALRPSRSWRGANGVPAVKPSRCAVSDPDVSRHAEGGDALLAARNAESPNPPSKNVASAMVVRYGYCAVVATRSVSILNFEIATCAAVPDLAVAAASGTDGRELSSAVA